MRHRFRVTVSCAAIAGALLATSAHAAATPSFDIPQQPLGRALTLFGQQAGQQIIFDPSVTANKQSRSIRGRMEADDALRAMIRDSGLTVKRHGKGLILSQLAPVGQVATQQAADPTEAAPAEQVETPADIPETDIVVTARKRAETVLTTPVIVSALSSAKIDLLGVTNIADVARLTPQLVVGDSPSVAGGAISLLGITSSEQNQFSDQAVLFSIDGTPISRAAVQRLALMDLEQVAIYKGPQTLFFGKNSYAGVIDIHSADPTPDLKVGGTIGYEFEGEEIRGEGFISGPVTDTLGFRVAVYSSSLSGYLRNVAPDDPLIGPKDRTLPDTREFAARTTLLYEPVESLSVKFKVAYQRMRSAGISQGQQLLDCPFGVSQTGGAIDGVGEPCRPDNRVERSDLGPNFHRLDPAYGETPYARLDQWLANLTVRYSIAERVELTSVSSYYNAKSRVLENFNNATAARFMAAGFQTLYDEEYSQELRLRASLSDELSVIVGGYYQHSDLNRFFKVAVNAANPVALFNDRAFQKGEAYSLFGQLTWKPAPWVELAGGGRYSDEEKRFAGAIAGVPVATAVPRGSWSNFSPEATLSFYPSGDTTIFGSYKKGFLSGGFNAGSGDVRTDRSYDEQKIEGGEIGAKTRLLDRALFLSLSGYQYDLTGLQVLTQVGLLQFVQNAGKASVKGIDFSWEYNTPIEGFSLQGALSYNRARYDQFITNCYAGQTIAMGCNLLPTPAGVFTAQDLKGSPLLRAPNYAGDAGFIYRAPLNERFLLTINGHTTYSSSYYADTTNNPRSRQESYWLFDAGVSLQSVSEGWKLALLGRNLSNERYVARTRDSILTGSGTGRAQAVLADVAGVVSRGREVWLRLSYEF